MNPLILNRDFQHPADGWYQIEPKGEHLNRETGIVQVIDDEAIQSIVNRFNAEASKPGFPGMLIDQEHFRHDPEKESRAFGWLMNTQARADGAYGQIRWTTTGKAAVDGGDYRFFSSEYDRRDAAVLNRDSKRIRPLRLAGLTLTNDPNNKGGRPITNRNDSGADDSAPSPQPPPHPRMKSVASLLGLAADASEESVHAEVLKLKNRLTTAEAEVAPLKNRATTLETENGELLKGLVESDLARFKNRIKPEKLATFKEGLLKNRAATLAVLESLVDEPAKPAANTDRLHNRATAPNKTPADLGLTEEQAKQNDAARASADLIMNRAKELQSAHPNRGWNQCWKQAETEAAAK